MADFKAKYDIGQKLFFIDEREGLWSVKLGEVKAINFGGKSWEKYQIAWNKQRPESSLWTDFNEAKDAALIKQQETNNRNIDLVSQIKEPTQLD